MKQIQILMPGSKSYTNRALITAALTAGTTNILGYSKSDDSEVLLKALRKVGVGIEVNDTMITVSGKGAAWRSVSAHIDIGHAGTAARFFLALAAYIPGEITIDGSARMRERPILELVSALCTLGAQITYLGEEGHLPVRVRGGGMQGGAVSLLGSVSSQYFSALLLVGPMFPEGISIRVEGEQISRSYIDMTIASMRDRGVAVQNDNYTRYSVVPGSSYSPGDQYIEGDASGASYLWGAAAILGNMVCVRNISPLSAQGDVHFPDILERMGCAVQRNIAEQWIEVTGPNELLAIPEVDMTLMPDTAQTLAIVASFAKGSTRIKGLSTLRVKETDRIVALQNELKKMGVEAKVEGDDLIVRGGGHHAASIATYSDHRMAMAFAIASLRVPEIHIENPEVVTKSFPTFWEEVEKIRRICEK